jgi:hypothetical protein
LPAKPGRQQPSSNLRSGKRGYPSCFAALDSVNIIVGAVEHMKHSNITHPGRIGQLALCACALAALTAVNPAQARTRWRPAPTISGAPATSDVAGHAYSFRPTASAPNGYRLSFSIHGKPSWATFSSATGQLSGTPASTNVGSFTNIVISVSDGPARAWLAPFSIKVSAAAPAPAPAPAPVNPPPTISGSPATTDIAGKLYTFTPTASDTDGDALSFSVQNLPSWATFSIATGTVSGTPATANVGAYSNIVISVSDGSTSVSLAPFAIYVTQPPATSGSAILSWTAPTTNTNGSALTNLAGYHIYYGTSAAALSTTINVSNPGTTSYSVSNLPSGTWYFAVNAYTTGGVDSVLSNTGSKIIP